MGKTQRHGGGSGCNLALNIKRLNSDMPVETITIVGGDELGRFLLSLARKAGIAHLQMHFRADASTQWTEMLSSPRPPDGVPTSSILML